jgi:hypothetical protein
MGFKPLHLSSNARALAIVVFPEPSGPKNILLALMNPVNIFMKSSLLRK